MHAVETVHPVTRADAWAPGLLHRGQFPQRADKPQDKGLDTPTRPA